MNFSFVKRIFKAAAIIFFIFLALPVFAYTKPGQPTGFVNDYAGVMSAEQKQALENKLSQFEKDSSNEIAIAIIPDLNGDTVENFTNELFKDWGIGKKNKDNGVLVLVAINDRKMRIEPGYGLEGALTDAQSSWIINQVMKPAFQNNDYYGGLDGAVDKIMAVTQGEYVPSTGGEQKEMGFFQEIFWYALILFGLRFFVAFLGRTKSWWLGGVIGFVLGAVVWFFSGLIMGLIWIAILAPGGLWIDWLVSKNYRKYTSKGKTPWWLGGGGSGGSGGGFGGFGGGSSGGGGASGGW